VTSVTSQLRHGLFLYELLRKYRILSICKVTMTYRQLCRMSSPSRSPNESNVFFSRPSS